MPKLQVPLTEKRAYTVNEAAAVIGISRSSVYNLISDGRLQSVRIAGRRLFPREAIEAMIAKAMLPTP